MADKFTDDDDALLAELGVEIEAKKQAARTPREERIIAGFEEIQKFVSEKGRLPRHSEEGDIFERLYAVRLDQIRALPEVVDLLADLDDGNLLSGVEPQVEEDLDDDALLAALGVDVERTSITELKHVRSAAERKAAEDVANRQKCEDFDRFEPLFEKVQRELDTGVRSTMVIRKEAGFLKSDIRKGEFFILYGQMLYVAAVGEEIKAPNGQRDARLRVIYANGTESDILLRSLQRAIYKDDASRRITEPSAGPLFADTPEDGDNTTGTIYVLRSKSDHPMVAANLELVHKIGVTTLGVEKRIAGAHLQPTFLMAPVEVVATYELYNISQTKFENLIHRIFGDAQLSIEIADRFGRPVSPREWFLVPLFVIDEAVQKIKDGTITNFRYDAGEARLVPR